MPVRAVDDKPSDTLVVVSGEGFWTGSSTLPHLHQNTRFRARRSPGRRTRCDAALSGRRCARLDHGQLAPAAQVDPFVREPDRPVFDDPTTPVGARKVEDRLDRPAVLEGTEQPLAIGLAGFGWNQDPPGDPAKPARWQVDQRARRIVTIDEDLVLAQPRGGHVGGLPPVLF